MTSNIHSQHFVFEDISKLQVVIEVRLFFLCFQKIDRSIGSTASGDFASAGLLTISVTVSNADDDLQAIDC